MPQASINTIPRGLDNDQLTEEINKRLKEIDWLLSGAIDSKNVREIGGWRVSKKQLASKDGSVGFSTEDTGFDDVRIWAGDAKDGSPNFVVTKSGLLQAIGAILKSKNGLYPYIELNSGSDLLRAYQDATSYVSIDPDITGSPGIQIKTPLLNAIISSVINYLFIQTLSGEIRIDSASNIELKAIGDIKITPTGLTIFQSWDRIFSTSSGQTLQLALSSLQSQINNLSSRVSALEARPYTPPAP